MRFRHFDSLRVFVELGRWGHMQQAADHLGLSKGAVSYQLARLESALGFPLFSRDHRGLSLTDRGRRLHELASTSLLALEGVIEQLQSDDGHRITVGMATYFASRWLSPRLMRFITNHPECALRIQPLLDLSDVDRQGIDLAIRWGKGTWDESGWLFERVLDCPAMLAGSIDVGRQIAHEGIEAVLERYPLLLDQEGSTAWDDWFACAGIAPQPHTDALVIPDPNVRVQAVIDGQGLALYDRLAADEVAAGRLYLHEAISMPDYGYYLMIPTRPRDGVAVDWFRRWIVEEARETPSTAGCF